MLIASSRTAYMTRTLTVGFSQQLPTGVTLTTPVVSAEPGIASSNIKDTQAGATATLGGQPATLNSQNVSIPTPNGPVIQTPGQAILQSVSVGMTGANYVYRFKATGTDGLTYEADVAQFVVPYVPTP